MAEENALGQRANENPDNVVLNGTLAVAAHPAPASGAAEARRRDRTLLVRTG
jgi:hypothetical protein